MIWPYDNRISVCMEIEHVTAEAHGLLVADIVFFELSLSSFLSMFLKRVC